MYWSTGVFLLSFAPGLCHVVPTATEKAMPIGRAETELSPTSGLPTTTASPLPTTTDDINYDELWLPYSSWFKSQHPYIPQDQWYCATENMTQYFQPPLPTGDLYSHMASYAGSIMDKTCTTNYYQCEDMGKQSWCDYTTNAPATFSSDLSSLGSAASSWVLAYSSGLAALPTRCPDSWNWAGIKVLDGHRWKNRSLVWAQCYQDAYSKAAKRGDAVTVLPDTNQA